MKYLRRNGLSLSFGLFFLLALGGQALAGLADYNDTAVSAGGAPIGFLAYLTSADFTANVAENWQSEYLQFLLYIYLTVWLIQTGSTESKRASEIGRETDEKQLLGRYATEDSPVWARAGGWRTRVYSSSLGLTMGGLFILSWLAQSVSGYSAYNSTQLGLLQDTVSYGQYLVSADFWNRTLQNWQSEFLAVGSMVVLSVYLRQRGSPESKPVGAAHVTTEESG